MRDKEFKLGNRLTGVILRNNLFTQFFLNMDICILQAGSIPKRASVFKLTVTFTKITQLSQEPLSLKYTSSFPRKDLEVSSLPYHILED